MTEAAAMNTDFSPIDHPSAWRASLRIYEGRGIEKQTGKSTYFSGDLDYSRFDEEDARM